MIPAVKCYAYKCYFCGGHLRRNKKSVLSHSERCFSNPSRKACRLCAFYKKEDVSIGDGFSFQQNTYCEKDIDITEKLKFNCSQWGLKDNAIASEVKD